LVDISKLAADRHFKTGHHKAWHAVDAVYFAWLGQMPVATAGLHPLIAAFTSPIEQAWKAV